MIRAHRNDLLLILALLLLAGGVWLGAVLTRRTGGAVELTADGETVAVFPLNEDRTYTWTGAAGTNTLVIENGAARMSWADCPDKLCVGQGAIRYAGESIVCLPHRLVITVTAGERASWDAVS